MNSKIVNKLSQFSLINGVACSLVGGTYLGYKGQKYEDTISDKIVGCSFGAIVGIIIGFPVGVILTITSPISVPVILYNKYTS